VGGGYALSVGKQVSMGLDVSWNRIQLDGGDQTFLTPVFTIRYHPHG
jgi:hypothetical protein